MKLKKAQKEIQKKKIPVLYQNLNGIWYAFAGVGEEVFCSAIDKNKISQKAVDKKKAVDKLLALKSKTS